MEAGSRRHVVRGRGKTKGWVVIRFSCLKCGAAVKVGQALAGKVGRCPRCKGNVQVPVPFSVMPLPTAVEVRSEDSGPEISHSPMRWLTVAAFGGLAIALTSSVVTGLLVLCLQSSPWPSVVPPPPVVQASFKPSPTLVKTVVLPESAPKEVDQEIVKRQAVEEEKRRIAEEEKQRLEEERRRRVAALLTEQARLAAIVREEEDKLALAVRAFQSLSPYDKDIVGRVAKKLRDLNCRTLSLPDEMRVLREQWGVLFYGDIFDQGIIRFANAFKFEEFCDNLKIPKDDQLAEIAAEYYLLPNDHSSGMLQHGSVMALFISRSIRQSGIKSVPHKGFVFMNEHPNLFKTVRR